jgi:hypothetical protein
VGAHDPIQMHKIQRAWEKVSSTITRSKKPCYIDKLPDDTLETIINLPCYIDKLPMNSLETIINVLVRCDHGDPIAYRIENGEHRAKFWHDFLFEFEKLIPNHNPKFVQPRHTERCGNLCKVLFSDPHFASWIARKSNWTFFIPGAFFVVTPHIPVNLIIQLNLHCIMDRELFLIEPMSFSRITQLCLNLRSDIRPVSVTQYMFPLDSPNTLTRLDLDNVCLDERFNLTQFFSLQACLPLPSTRPRRHSLLPEISERLPVHIEVL